MIKLTLVAIMIAVMVSKFVGDTFGKQGIYESWIGLQNYPYLEKSHESFYGVSVENIMQPLDRLSNIYVSDENTIASIRSRLQDGEVSGYPILADSQSNLLLGFIATNDLHQAIFDHIDMPPGTMTHFTDMPHGSNSRPSINLKAYVDDTPFILGVQSSIRLVVNLFQQMGLRYIFFRRGGSLAGMITKNDLLNAHHSPEEWDLDDSDHVLPV